MPFTSRFGSVVSLAVFAAAEAGTIIYVDDDNCPGPGSGTLRDPYCTIQSAIDAAVNGDEIVVADGLYTGPGNRDLDFGGRLITLRSENGAATCIIDCEDAGRGFLFINGETSAAVVDGLTIQNGFVDELSPFGAKGAGIYIVGSSPTVTDCIFSSNCACPGDFDAWGGAIYSFAGSPTITGCTFSANGAGSIGADYASGGGILTSGGSATVAGCAFFGNYVFGRCLGRGGAINRSGNDIVTDCVFSNNSAATGACGGGATADGGAVYGGGGPAWIINCAFMENHVNGSGGGASSGGAMAGGIETVINCAFTGNSTTGLIASGGAMRGTQTIINSAFIGNSALTAPGGGSGGALHALTGGTLVNCTFAGNRAGINGGGAYTGTATTVTNCILWSDSPDEIAGAATVTYSNVQGGRSGVGNINADPMFVDPANGDYRLSAGSPCIDAGNNAAMPEDTDLDGNPRFHDDPAVPDTGNGGAPVVDMGAYEFQGNSCPWDCDGSGDGNANVSDLLSLLGQYDSETPKVCDGGSCDFDGNGCVDVVDLLKLLAHYTTDPPRTGCP